MDRQHTLSFCRFFLLSLFIHGLFMTLMSHSRTRVFLMKQFFLMKKIPQEFPAEKNSSYSLSLINQNELQKKIHSLQYKRSKLIHHSHSISSMPEVKLNNDHSHYLMKQGIESVVKSSENLQHLLLEQYFDQLRKMIHQLKKYPAQSLWQEEQGQVILRLEIHHRQELSRAHVLQSSGFTILDQHSLVIVRSAMATHPLPKDINLEKIILDIPLEFKIED